MTDQESREFWQAVSEAKPQLKALGAVLVGLFLLLVVLTVGPKKERKAMPPGIPPTIGAVAIRNPLPEEYRMLADAITDPMHPSQLDFVNVPITESIAKARMEIRALENIHSEDEDIVFVAAQAHDVGIAMLEHWDHLSSLELPPGLFSQAVDSLLDGLCLDFKSLRIRSDDAAAKTKAILDEIRAGAAALEKLASTHLMLPAIAARYAAPQAVELSLLIVDFDQVWGSPGRYDWFSAYNNSLHDLNDCTLVVQLIGSLGDSCKNVHFIRNWPARTWVRARYDYGQEIEDRRVGSQTVPMVATIDATLWSPSLSTRIRYTYQGVERDKDIAARCEKLNFSGHYRPFVKGYLWNTEAGAVFRMRGVEMLPKCAVNITFKNHPHSKAWQSQVDGWKDGEEQTFEVPKKGLIFDPDQIDLSVSFPGSDYRHQTTLKFGP